MMTRVFLAAGVAALAIAAPANAGPHNGGHKDDRQAASANHGGGGQRAQAVQRQRGGGGHAARAQAAPRQHAQRVAMQRPQRQERVQMRAERQRPSHAARQQTRVAQHSNHAQARERVAARQQTRANHAQAQNRMAQRQQKANRVQAQDRTAQRQQIKANRAQAQNRMAQRQQLRGNRQMAQQDLRAQRQQVRAERMNVLQQHVRGNLKTADRRVLAQELRRMPVQNRVATLRDMGDARFVPLNVVPTRNILAPVVASSLIGVPLATAATFGTFSPFPSDLAYLYPATPNYYYQYGNGYAYRIDRGSNLIDALIPLLAGGFLPGSYLPSAYMNSYVPSYYGLNSFYPSSYGGYGYGGYGGYSDYGGYGGYGYNNLCNRYANGVIYRVDCVTGMVADVVPLYAGGYGVGQMLPSAYSYYNVPLQYRSMYYPTADYSYWYAPGAIYQYDQRSSLITSVAALMSPGFTIGQPLPAGYGMYNVPLGYRATYYDTPNAWYRYNNGYIYQVDPTTQLVSAVVASLLT